MEEARTYGVERIAERAETSPRNVRRWLGWPEGAFFEVASISNAGGGLGWAIATMPSSLDHFLQVIRPQRIERKRSAAAGCRWSGKTAVNSLHNW